MFEDVLVHVPRPFTGIMLMADMFVVLRVKRSSFVLLLAAGECVLSGMLPV